MKFLFKHKTCHLFRKPYRFFIPRYSIDMDVVRLVFEMTRNRWLYTYYIIRSWLMIVDRFLDFFAIVKFATQFVTNNSSPHWYVCLCLYITLRIISLADCVVSCCKRKYFECYRVRTGLLTIVSMFCCTVLFLEDILRDVNYKFIAMYYVGIPAGCISYVFLFVWVFSKIQCF